MGWEDRLTQEQRDKVNAALDRFADNSDCEQLYEDLVVAGMHPEEADEYVNLMVEGDGEF